jgi:hypothetical protein
MNEASQQPQSKPAEATQPHAGGCHCGRVRYEVLLAPNVSTYRCNCSICTKLALTEAIVEPEAFVLLAGDQELGMYEWGKKTGRRFFCKHCGVHCFAPGYLEELGGHHVAVSMHSFDDIDPNQLAPIHWDGRHDNWQAGPRSTPWPIFTEETAEPR